MKSQGWGVPIRRWLLVGAFGFIVALAPEAATAAGKGEFKDFADLSLEELLNQVVVTSSRHESPLSKSPTTMHVITEDEIRHSPAQTLSELLRMVPGFETKTWLTEFTNTSIRGMVGASVINERILWMIDGVPVNDVRDGGIWTDITLPLANIKRIEVLSGPGSALYGSNAFVGVIHILTKDPEDFLARGQRGELQTDWSSYDTSVNHLTVAGTTGRTAWSWTADAGSTRGPGLVRDHLMADPAKMADPTKNGNIGDPHSGRIWGYLRGKYHWARNKLNLGMRGVHQDYDGADFSSYRYYTWRRGEKWVDWHHDLSRAGGRATDTLVLSWHGFTENFYDFADLPGLDYDITSHRWHVNLQREQRFGRHQMTFGTGLRSESYRGNDFYPDRRDILKNNVNVFFQDEWSLNRLWSLSWGGRYDTHPNYQNILSPHASLMREFNDGRGRVRLTSGKAFKEPSNWQSYIDQPSGMGNRDMQPERLTSSELSVEYTFPKELFTRATYYQLKHENIIWENFDPAVADKNYNIGGKFHPQQPGDYAKIEGLEWEMKKRFSPKNRMSLSYVHLSSRDNLGRALQYDAPNKVSGSFWHAFDKHLSLTLESHWVSSTTDTVLREDPMVGVRDVPAYHVTGVSLLRKLSENETLKLSAWNIGRSVYEEMLGAPVPGTQIRLSFLRSF